MALFKLPQSVVDNYNRRKSTDWKWSFADYPKEKNGLKVFSCFACGGGSTMGYKLAGCDVIGDLEIDPRMNEVYVKNHHPKYNYCMDIRDFNKIPNEELSEELFDLDILDGSFPCFSEDVMVHTSDGYKSIKDVQVGDLVFTHKGRYQPVYNTMNKMADKYYELKIQGCLPFKVTPNHPFYVRRMVRKGHIASRTFEQPKWVEVKDLEISRNKSNTIKYQDYIGFP